MKVLIIAAHPDDEVYGMGGTIAKLASRGNEVYTLIITEGCSTQYNGNKEIIQEKKEEAIKANKILGVKKVLFGDLPDMKLDILPHVDINRVIEEAIDKIKPEIVYTHHKGDINKDHRMVYESTLVATRPQYQQCVKKLLSYQVPSSTEWNAQVVDEIFMPNIFEEIEQCYYLKKEAINAYQTEIREYPHPRSLEYVETLDKSVGLRVGTGKAEAFQLIRDIQK